MTYRPKVYFASKLRHGSLWRRFREDMQDIEVVSRWLDLEGANVANDDPANAIQFWRHDVHDVQRCDVVLVYAEGEDKNRGALVEAGVGIGCGKHIIVVGEHPDYGSWQYHPLVSRVPTLADAFRLIRGDWTYGKFAHEVYNA